MASVTNKKIAATLEELADAMEIREENPFRIRAHRKAAQSIENSPQSLAEIYEEGGAKGLQELPGIGKGIASKIAEMLETGALAEHEAVAEEVPASLRELLNVPNVGPKSVKQLHDALGIASLEELQKACEEGRVRALDGFGAKKEAKLLEAVRAYAGREERFLVSTAEEYAALLRAHLEKVSGVDRVTPAGSLRRRRDSIGDLDLLVTADRGAKVMEAFVSHPAVDEVIARGETKTSVLLDNGMQADLRLVDPDCYGAALVYFTGSKAHNVALRTRAKAEGLKVSEYGVFRGEDRVAGESEEEIYALLGLDWIPPELREDRGELEAAAEGKLPELIHLDDMRGDLQMHTTSSDGKASAAEMAAAARDLGYEYIALTDHSKAVRVAGGLDDDELLTWWKEIDRVDDETDGIRILKGVEVDILKEGDLDLKEATLERGDVIVATVHSHFRLSPQEQTKRLTKALESGVVHVWGHPLGRRIGKREPIDCDLDEVLRVCAGEGIAVEINAHPERLDFEDRHVMAAVEAGCKIVISTDAHSTDGLAMMRYGIGIARRAWLTRKDVLNTLPLEGFLKAVARS